MDPIRRKCGCVFFILKVAKPVAPGSPPIEPDINITISECPGHQHAGAMVRLLQKASLSEKLEAELQEEVDALLAKLKTSWE